MAEPTPLLKPLAPAVMEPQLWKAGRFVDDAWRALADDAPLPPDGRALVPLARWRAILQAGIDGSPQLGIIVHPGEVFDPSADDVARLHVVALVFPKFADGRAYTSARRLRERWGFRGEIRATGDVLLDQIPLMLRSGFDAFQIVDAATIKALREGALPAVSRVYQKGGTDRSGRWLHRTGATV